MSFKLKVLIGAVMVLGLFWLSSNIRLSCSDLEHTSWDQMDSATRQFYVAQCNK